LLIGVFGDTIQRVVFAGDGAVGVRYCQDISVPIERIRNATIRISPAGYSARGVIFKLTLLVAAIGD
jgi:hypothetical protein